MANIHVSLSHGRLERAQSRRGLVLVAAVGVLGVLSVMALAFASVMRLEARATRNYSNSVRVEFIARAGIEDAISRLRSMARDGAELPYENGQPAAWYTWTGTAGGTWKHSFPANEATNCIDDDGDGLIDALDSDEGNDDFLAYSDTLAGTYADGGDTYSLRVEDAAGKINVNAGDNLGTILDNLCRVIGPPLVAATEEATVPKWFTQTYRQYSSAANNLDQEDTSDLFYRLDTDGRPVCDNTGRAIYGDGYAIAGWRARHGAFLSVEDVRAALTWFERGDGDEDDEVEPDTYEERLEIEAKVAALKPYLTVDSWNDTDQIGYGKFEHVKLNGTGAAVRLIDRNRTWNVNQNDGEGELAGCLVSIVNGVGMGQLKTIVKNTIDTIYLGGSMNPDSVMLAPPNQNSSYIIIGKDHRGDSSWQEQAKLYARQPLSIHRAPVNVNTATDKVLTALLLGLQTNWGPAGYYTNSRVRAVAADAYSICPSILSIGRDEHNALFSWTLPCPNDSTLSIKMVDPLLMDHGHPGGEAPFCFFCNYGAAHFGGRPGYVGEAHYLTWQILKEREQTREQDERSDRPREKHTNGFGPFRGWDDLYFRVFRPWERGLEEELSLKALSVPLGTIVGARLQHSRGQSTEGHPGIARLCMANFSSNTDILKYQPNIEWVNRWGANFTDLYLPHPDLLVGDGADVKLRVRPGELLDKTDLNVGTTEFCFDSRGVYVVESTGRIADDTSVVAEKRLSALVRIYDVWRESTQREFIMGDISRALGEAGTCMAGQYAVDDDCKGGAALVRKSLNTYPEPLVPGEYRNASGKTPALGYSTGRTATGSVIQPAGYDGHIMLATNTSITHEAAAPPDVSFYNSFTGDITADFALGDPETVSDPQPIDLVGLQGKLDSREYDVIPVRDASGRVLEGEGPGGDLRPDGLFLGIVGWDLVDGSLEYAVPNNFNPHQGAVTMWVKPMWHHGTYMRASLPVGYNPSGADEMGSTVLMKRNWQYSPKSGDCKSKWPCGSQVYSGDSDRAGVGYVRDRFEHEFFNAAVPGAGWGAVAFRVGKTGDIMNSAGDGDVYQADLQSEYGTPMASMLFDFEGGSGVVDFGVWIPGWLYPDSKPFYQMCPFRWNFVGMIWTYGVPNRPYFFGGHWAQNPSYRSDHGRREMRQYIHSACGQPCEPIIEQGLAVAADPEGNPPIDQDGDVYTSPIIPYGDHKDRTAASNLSLVMIGHPFVDTQRTWDKVPQMIDNAESGMYYGTRPNTSRHYDLEGWAFEQYGTYLQGEVLNVGSPRGPNPTQFGINRVASEGRHVYQRVRSGSYFTIDEFTVFNRWKDCTTGGDDGFDWPRTQRSPGRYYFDKDGTNRPQFTSQCLFESEQSQSYTFGDSESDVVVELGTVRWTVFTPFYCIHQPGRSEFEFPYDSYFLETERVGNTGGAVSQSWRPAPNQWERGATSRNSSQRGCVVSIDSGNSPMPTEDDYEYTDPEGWEPILARGGASGQHARSSPSELRYKVRFGFSRDEYRATTRDATLIDTPVFDDISVTFMRRPKVLRWRDVTQ